MSTNSKIFAERNKNLDATAILIDSFGQVLLNLVITNRISQEQFKLILDETQKAVTKNLNDAVIDKELELAHLKAQLKPYEQKN